ncbi:MAG: amidase [Solirubrobacteraceae bacterium]
MRLDRGRIEEYSRRYRMALTQDEMAELEPLAQAALSKLERFDALHDDGGVPPGARDTPTPAPTGADDPYNAVVRWCSVKSSSAGLLAGKRIGLKDNIALAGIPMTCGSRILDGYRPDEDAVLVQRLLSQGAEIVAMLNMDSFAFSGSGETSDYGTILNPLDPTRTAGGSSGGSAAALYYDGIDITFGTDQAGSVRIPASWCGVLGLKPTFGLVPYTGIFSQDPTFDHVGPLARTVSDLALALEAVAGPDDRVPTPGEKSVAGFLAAVDDAPARLDGVTIGLVREGMADDVGADAVTRAAVRDAVDRFAELGARVEEISIPEHTWTRDGLGGALSFESCMASLRAFGSGYHVFGRHAPDLANALGRALETSAADLPPAVKLAVIVGAYSNERYFGSLYAKAQNRRPSLRVAYDRALQSVDVLMMPTTPMPAYTREPDLSIAAQVRRGARMIDNTTPFNLTGHPSLSIPAARVDALPLGVMLTASHWSDARLLALARTYERAHGWYPEPR